MIIRYITTCGWQTSLYSLSSNRVVRENNMAPAGPKLSATYQTGTARPSNSQGGETNLQ